MRLWLRPEERRETPPPVPVDDRRAFATGTVLWAVAALALLAFGSALEPVVVWTAVAGVALGLIGLLYTAVKRRRAQ